MKKQGIVFREGLDYSFVEYGGNNVTHWSFLPDERIETINASGITNRSLIVLDNDNDSKNKTERKKALKQVFGKKNYVELSVREIENTIKIDVLEKMLFPDGEPVKRIEKKRGEDSKNGKDRRYDTKEDRIWIYIDESYALRKKYWDIKQNRCRENKVTFAKKVVSQMNDFDDLSDNAKKLCKRICDFLISVQNDIEGASTV